MAKLDEVIGVYRFQRNYQYKYFLSETTLLSVWVFIYHLLQRTEQQINATHASRTEGREFDSWSSQTNDLIPVTI